MRERERETGAALARLSLLASLACIYIRCLSRVNQAKKLIVVYADSPAAAAGFPSGRVWLACYFNPVSMGMGIGNLQMGESILCRYSVYDSPLECRMSICYLVGCRNDEFLTSNSKNCRTGVYSIHA